jgi:hypothetical protein
MFFQRRRNPMELKKYFVAPELKYTLSLHARMVLVHPLSGEKELLELRLNGFRDDDGDLKPEFDIDFEVLDKDMIPESFQSVELDISKVLSALGGGQDAMKALFDMVVDALAEKGLKLPF